ncbi:MAG: hypothetical protein AAFU71_12735 [Cyanobacteria bacterium J06632_22]
MAGLLLSLWVSYQLVPVLPVWAQQAGEQVENTVSGEFETAGGPRTSTTSNQVQYRLQGDSGVLLRIVKTADKTAVEPADVVVYRLLVTNLSNRDATPLTVVDLMPRGIQYVVDSANAEPALARAVEINGPQLTFEIPSLAAGESASIIYAASVTPDAIRGSGRNVAQASAPGFPTVDAAFQLTIQPGILADCGTIIGRVFVDKNFDGEQQAGEPGIPNAVIFLDDGNRIITDPEGLFSIANVVSGNRVGALDLSSLPGYTLAPNLYRIGDNSQSRLVRLSPGGLARMNFAVTPTYGEGQN